MHILQEKIQNMNQDNLTDETLFQIVSNCWTMICEENLAHRHIVTGEAYRSWLDHKAKVDKDLKRLARSLGNRASPGVRRSLLDYLRSFSTAAHKSEEELIAEFK